MESARLAKIEQEKDEILADASYEISEGDPNRAVALYTRVLEMEGSSPEAAGGLVLAHLKLKNATVALQLLDQHRALLGDGAAAHLLRAQALRALEKKDEAEVIEKNAPAPQSAFEHQLLAQRALQSCKTADKPTLELALRHATAAILLSPAPRLSLYTLRAHAAGHAKDRDAAVETAAGLRHRWPDSGFVLFWCGFTLSEQGDPALLDEGIATYREGIRSEAGRDTLHCNLGVALEKKGLIDDAIAAYREAIRLRPATPTAHTQPRRRPHGRKASSTTRSPPYREAIRLNPELRRGPLQPRSAVGALGQAREALAELRRGHEIGSRQPGWRHPSEQWVAEAQQRVDDEAGARSAARRARRGGNPTGEMRPSSSPWRASRSNQGRPALAARWFQAAFEESPDLADAIDRASTPRGAGGSPRLDRRN